MSRFLVRSTTRAVWAPGAGFVVVVALVLFRLSGGVWPLRVGLSARIGTCPPSLSFSSLPWGWHRVLCLVIAWDGGRGHVWPITRCSGGGDGLTCRESNPRVWRTSHSGGVDRRASAP
nr:MAG TPA: hypothetical protein [Caudoviricetes sp.]